MADHITDQLYQVILSRRGADPKKSWTARLLVEAPSLPARKLGEEASEMIIAAMSGKTEDIVAEAADVLYHLLVLLAASDVPLDALWDELSARRAMSGIDEKNSRKTLKEDEHGV